MSGEHYVTRGIWERLDVSVGGLSQFNGERRDLTIDALKVKSLCKHHNETSSPLDQALIAR
jgi:hypothetical protein